MTFLSLIVAVDPGPTPGVTVLHVGLERGNHMPQVFQCNAGSVGWLVREALAEQTGLPWERRILAVERFVVGPRAARSSTPAAGKLTQDMVGELLALGQSLDGVQVVQRSASEVMPWSTDKRLDAAGLLAPTKGMQHARAAARHAIFCAVADAGAPDPLSRRAGEQ